MKHVFAALLLFFTYAAIRAQPDPLNYYVVLKDSTAFNCKIPYRKQGQIIKAVKPDSTEAYIGWGNINTIYLIKNDSSKLDESAVSAAELKKIKQAEESIIERKTWKPCFIVLFRGDTLYGIADPARDFSITGSYDEWSKEYWGNNEIRIKGNDETDESYNLAQVKEIVFTDVNDVVKYFNVKGDMYKVVADGEVMLLRRHKLPTGAKDHFLNLPALPTAEAIADGSYAWGPTGGYKMGTEDRKFCLYKSGKLYELKTQTGFVRATDDFIEDCETLFEGCPAVITRITTQKGRNVNLKSVIEEYNLCTKQ